MPRSNWKGVISFGLVSIPIILFNSQDPSSNVSFKQINRKTGSKIKYKRVDAETGKEVPWDQIGKGYEYEKDQILPVEEDELKRVAGENARTIAIEEFVDKDNLNFINIENTYYLVPDKKGEKGYVILREALNKSNKVGIAKVIISTKEYLAAVATYKDALVLYLLHYSDEIRNLDQFDIPAEDMKKYKVTPKEVEIAKKLITSMSAKWKPEKYSDEYKEAVGEWVAAKVKNKPETKMKSRAANPKTTNGVNFVDLLKQSLSSSKRPVKNKKLKAKAAHVKAKRPAHRTTATRH